MDRFPWSSGWEYLQVSWLSSHSNKTIRREPLSPVLVNVQVSNIPDKKLRSILKKTVTQYISFSIVTL